MRHYWCDFARAVACLMVVSLHAATPFAAIRSDASWYQASLLLEAFTRCSVPLFFMLSGYLAFRENRPVTGQTISKRLLRAFAPLAFYTAIYVPFSVLWVGHPMPNPVGEPAFYHLWFFYVYALTTVILLLVYPSSVPAGYGALITLAILLLCAGGLQAFGVRHGFMHVSGVAVYLLYCMAGYYVARLEMTRLYVATAMAMFVFSSMATAWITMQKSLDAMALDQTFYQYDASLVVLASFSGFYLIKYLSPYFEWMSKPVHSLASTSLGVFGLHPLFLHIALENSGSGVLWMVGVIAFSVACSWVASLMIRRIPYGNLVA